MRRRALRGFAREALTARIRLAVSTLPDPDAHPMQIDVLFFASYRELAGADHRSVTLPDGASAGDLVRELRALGDGLAALPEGAAVVVNQRVVRSDHSIAPTDEVALLPPVAGG